MRRVLLLALFAALALPAQAARRITVDQLRQMLVSRLAAHESDSSLAQRLYSQELSEQLTSLTLQRLTSELKPGRQTALALDLLADTSAFLEPPSGELPQLEPPDAAARELMLNEAANFAQVTLHHLPNFLATRITRSYDNTPLIRMRDGSAPQSAYLHSSGTLSEEITYRDGHEVVSISPGASITNKTATDPVGGLRSTGEFGPVLAIVLADSSHGTVTWSRWEHTPSGLAAVFRYEVPKTVSHYTVTYCCVGGKRLPTLNPVLGPETSDRYNGSPGYHGQLYLDPATGAVLGLTLEAQLKNSDPIRRAAVSVQYAKVDISGSAYVCPVQSVAVSSVLVRSNPEEYWIVRRVNHVTFSNYHRFGSTMRILEGAPAQ